MKRVAASSSRTGECTEVHRCRGCGRAFFAQPVLGSRRGDLLTLLDGELS